MADISVWQPKFHLGGRKSTATLTTGDDGSTEDISSDMVEGGGEDATFLLSVAPPELMRVESSGSDESATDIAPSRSSQNEGDAGESAVVVPQLPAQIPGSSRLPRAVSTSTSRRVQQGGVKLHRTESRIPLDARYSNLLKSTFSQSIDEQDSTPGGQLSLPSSVRESIAKDFEIDLSFSIIGCPPMLTKEKRGHDVPRNHPHQEVGDTDEKEPHESHDNLPLALDRSVSPVSKPHISPVPSQQSSANQADSTFDPADLERAINDMTFGASEEIDRLDPDELQQSSEMPAAAEPQEAYSRDDQLVVSEKADDVALDASEDLLYGKDTTRKNDLQDSVSQPSSKWRPNPCSASQILRTRDEPDPTKLLVEGNSRTEERVDLVDEDNRNIPIHWASSEGGLPDQIVLSETADERLESGTETPTPSSSPFALRTGMEEVKSGQRVKETSRPSIDGQVTGQQSRSATPSAMMSDNGKGLPQEREHENSSSMQCGSRTHRSRQNRGTQPTLTIPKGPIFSQKRTPSIRKPVTATPTPSGPPIQRRALSSASMNRSAKLGLSTQLKKTTGAAVKPALPPVAARSAVRSGASPPIVPTAPSRSKAVAPTGDPNPKRVTNSFQTYLNDLPKIERKPSAVVSIPDFSKLHAANELRKEKVMQQRRMPSTTVQCGRTPGKVSRARMAERAEYFDNANSKYQQVREAARERFFQEKKEQDLQAACELRRKIASRAHPTA